MEYWLENVRTLSHSSPVLLVQNKIDRDGKQVHEKFNELKEKYNVKDFCEVSAASGKNLNILQEQIREQFAEAPELKGIIGYDFPNTWRRVREILEQLAKEKNTISYAQYREICEKEGITPEGAATLCCFLHEIAVVFHFAKSERLRSLVIINPIWATELVYKILNDQVRQKEGLFDQKHVVTMLSEFYEEEQKNFIDLLLRFELCFKIAGEEGKYIAPQFLPQDKPKGFNMMWKSSEPPSLIYHYPRFLHKSVMIRFLARFVSVRWRKKKSIGKTDFFSKKGELALL